MGRVILLAALVALLAVPGAAGAVPPNRAAALEQWFTIGEATLVPAGWTGSPATCTRGEESAASIAATLRAVNALRDFAGLAPVTFDPVLNARALSAALMMNAASSLSHSPGASWPCYSAEGAAAASASNLYLGRSGAAAMVGYVDDAGVASLGHRQWLLDPAATVFGTGSTGRTNALLVLTPHAGAPPAPAVVAWPPAGWVPSALVFDDWSAEFSGAVDLSRATVGVAVDGAPRPVTGVTPMGSTLKWQVALTDADRTGEHVIDVTVAAGAVRHSYRIQTFQADPPRPVRFTTQRDAGSITLAWEPATEQGAAVTGYRLVGTGPGGPVFDIVVGPDQRSATIAVPDGVTLSFAVIPLSRAGSTGTGGGSGLTPTLTTDGPAFGRTSVPSALDDATGEASSWRPAAPRFTRAVQLLRMTPRLPLKPGRRLTLGALTWRDANRIQYQWLRNGRSIRGATRPTYTIKSADRRRVLRIRVTAVGPGGRLARTSAGLRVPR